VLIWEAAGSPLPCDTKGIVIPTARAQSHCARCGCTDGEYAAAQLVSQNFLPTRNDNRLSAFGGNRFCKACVFAAKTLRLRCLPWFASASGVEFYRTRAEVKGAVSPDPLKRLLSPPEPPFVAGIPLYGIAHGGEAHWRRTWWPGERTPADPLIRLQSKHVALYSRTAYGRERYPVQIDDNKDVVVDRGVWGAAREVANAAMSAAIADGCKPWAAKRALAALAPPSGASPLLVRRWGELTRTLVPHAQSSWWLIFCSLIRELEVTG